MPTKEVSLDELLNMAVAKLPPLRQRVTQRRLANKRYREHVLDELALELCNDPECAALKAVMERDTFSGQTRFSIDLDNLEKFLQIIIKYLPTILELVLKFLPLFM